jgi:hypothetical protein
MPLQRPTSRGQRAKRSVATFKGLIANGLIAALHKVLKVIRGLHHCRATGAGRCTKLASGPPTSTPNATSYPEQSRRRT